MVPFSPTAKAQDSGTPDGAPRAPSSFPKVELYDVFISYRHARRDKRFALELLRHLEGLGYRVALDERDFEAVSRQPTGIMAPLEALMNGPRTHYLIEVYVPGPTSADVPDIDTGVDASDPLKAGA